MAGSSFVTFVQNVALCPGSPVLGVGVAPWAVKADSEASTTVHVLNLPHTASFVNGNVQIAACLRGQFPVCAASLAGVVSFYAPGACTVQADQDGNTQTVAGVSVTQTFQVGRGALALSFTSVAPVQAQFDTAPVYVPVASLVVPNTGVDAALAPFNYATAISVDASSVLVCTMGSFTVIHAGSANAISTSRQVYFAGNGTCLLNATLQTSQSIFNVPTAATQSFTVARQAQVLAFTSSPPVATVGGTYTPAAITATANPVQRVLAGTASGSSTTVTFTQPQDLVVGQGLVGSGVLPNTVVLGPQGPTANVLLGNAQTNAGNTNNIIFTTTPLATISAGAVITGAGVLPNTVIVSGSGTTYTISPAQLLPLTLLRLNGSLTLSDRRVGSRFEAGEWTRRTRTGRVD